MGKFAPDIVLDAPADVIDQANIMYLCSAQPANYAGIAAVALADVAMTPNTDFTKADGDTNGRKVTVAAKNTVTVDTSGTGNHVVLASTGDSTLRYVTTSNSQAVTAGNTVNFPAWDIEIADPT
jgi:hypothetical protein